MRQGPLIIALLLLAGCAAREPADTAEPLTSALSAHQAGLAAVGAHPAVAPAQGAVRAVTAPRRAEPQGAAPGRAEQLVGQTPEVVLRWLGEPRLRRAEGPAEIWHYQAEPCHLDLILYREEDAPATLRVAFAAARAAGTERQGEAACLREIGRAAARPGGPMPAMPPARVVATGA